MDPTPLEADCDRAIRDPLSFLSRILIFTVFYLSLSYRSVTSSIRIPSASFGNLTVFLGISYNKKTVPCGI